MEVRAGRGLRVVAGVAVVAAPVIGHAALALGQGYGVALALAAVQAVAAGVVLSGAVAGWVGGAVAGALLAAMAAGGWWSAERGFLAGSGVAHALLYGGLLWVFAASLRPGRTSVVTRFASRINPTFHAGMVPYTRAVTGAWCVFFAGQLVVSAVLLAWAPGWWRAFVGGLHAPLVAVMAVAEVMVRRWRWRHEHATGLVAMVRGVWRFRAEAAGGRTSGPAGDCPGRSGSGTPRPPAP